MSGNRTLEGKQKQKQTTTYVWKCPDSDKNMSKNMSSDKNCMSQLRRTDCLLDAHLFWVCKLQCPQSLMKNQCHQ